ncbi:MAG: hypothetical protein GXP32_02180 [Kiritimatiellaeota bacterium]|nr:hypothetical protein [Kiritimatiellota bacterium]
MAFSKKYLLIGLIAQEKQVEDLKNKCETIGVGPIWSDDCFETMIMPEPKSHRYCQIICNSRGIHHVLKRGPKKKTKGKHRQASGLSLLSRSYHNINEYVKLTWSKH